MRKLWFVPAAAAALGGVFVAGVALRPLLERQTPAIAAVPQIQRVASGPVPAMTLPDFVTLVERNGPAVVNIKVTARGRFGNAEFPGLDDSPFAPFFRQFGMPRQDEYIQQGEGSGFIVRKDGIILTNTHVVSGATKVQVKLTDRREFTAKVLGSDPKTDVAVLKIESKEDLPVVTLGDSESVRVGQWVVAIGAPFGFENSVTSGIVSAKARTVPGNDGAVPFIQTDVAVNPGNSGGPLFDLNGNVVGINSQIYSRSGGYQGISFAIPIETALNVQQQILLTGTVQHGKLGVEVGPVSQELAEAFGLPNVDGALVGRIESGSSAERAGVKLGDVILQVDKMKITDTAQLVAAVSNMLPGSKVKLTVWRDKRKVDLSAELSGQTAEALKARDDRREEPEGTSGKLGLAVRPLSSDEQRQSGLKEGLLVEDSSGAAALAGIEPGDIIVAVNQKPVSTVQELRSMVAAAGKRPLALLIQRGTTRLYIPVTVG